MTGVARAPGKLVLSGSYSVLWGAPAIVTAVGRYAVADAHRPAAHESEEVLVAVRRGLVPSACFVDVRDLRVDLGGGQSRKIGLGSSAAILLSTMVAHGGQPLDEAARQALFERALAVHREAQGGGSGIDVAASTFGGTRAFRLAADKTASTAPLALPRALVIEVFAARSSAVTASFVAKVRALESADATGFRAILDRAIAGAAGAHDACGEGSDARAFVTALRAQTDALAILGERAGVPIVTADVARLATTAVEREDGAFFGPSGAGGGDVAFYAHDRAASSSFVEVAASLGYDRIGCAFGVEGVSEVPR